MNKNILLTTGIICSLTAFGAEEKLVSEEKPQPNIASAARTPTRGEGIFGEYWWANRFLEKHQDVERCRGKSVEVVMLGDSIVHFWEWQHPVSWAKFCQGKMRVLNLGYGGDTVQAVNWRITHGELDGYEAKNIVLMIGTNNNSSKNSKPENVFRGIRRIIEIIREKQPKAHLVLHPIFPRGNAAGDERHEGPAARNRATNALLKDYALAEKIDYVDFNDKWVDETGWVPKALMADGIHPSDAGYDIWMDALKGHLVK